MKFIQEALEHRSMQITSDVYSHVSKMIETDAIERVEKYPEHIAKIKRLTPYIMFAPHTKTP